MAKQKIDELDKKILNKMLERKSVKHAEIAASLGVGTATVNKRIHRMIKSGVIEGFIPKANTKKIGYNVTAIVNMRLKYAKAGDAISKWARDKNVCAIYKVTGAYDAVIIAKFKSTEELDEFNRRMILDELLERTNTSLVFSSQKEGQIPNTIL